MIVPCWLTPGVALLPGLSRPDESPPAQEASHVALWMVPETLVLTHVRGWVVENQGVGDVILGVVDGNPVVVPGVGSEARGSGSF